MIVLQRPVIMDFHLSKTVHVLLGSGIHRIFGVFRVIAFFSPHVQNQSDGEKVEIGDADPDLHAPEHEQRRRQFPFGAAPFFLAETSVNRLLPQRSRISGRTS